MKQIIATPCVLVLAIAAIAAQAPRPAVPTIPFESAIDFLKLSPDMNLGEVLGVAVNSKGHVVVLNHQGNAAAGPLYGNASTQILEFDQTGKFVREIGKGVYGIGYSHSVRFDKYDNLWVVDKGTNAVVKFSAAGMVTLNLGRRPEGPDDPAEAYYRPGRREPPVHVDGYFRQPTDVAWDSDDNIYVTPHNIGIDRQNHVYVADRGNRRIQVFDVDGKFLRMIHLNVPYDKKRHPVLGNLPANPPDETAPWTICITNTPTQYLFTTDQEPGRIYKLSLDGTILGMLGEAGRGVKQFNWIHGLACPSEDVVFVADMNNWRIQKITLRPDRSKPATRN